MAIQLGGSDPKQLAEVAKIAEDYGISEKLANELIKEGRELNHSRK